jgi:hypothetical protein
MSVWRVFTVISGAMWDDRTAPYRVRLMQTGDRSLCPFPRFVSSLRSCLAHRTDTSARGAQGWNRNQFQPQCDQVEAKCSPESEGAKMVPELAIRYDHDLRPTSAQCSSCGQQMPGLPPDRRFGSIRLKPLSAWTTISERSRFSTLGEFRVFLFSTSAPLWQLGMIRRARGRASERCERTRSENNSSTSVKSFELLG